MKRTNIDISYKVQSLVENYLLSQYTQDIPKEFHDILFNIFRHEIHDAIKDTVWDMNK